MADAATLGTLVDGVILIIEAGSNRADEVNYVVNEMRRIHIPFIGAVLNRIPRKKKAYYYSYYSYYNRDVGGQQPSHRSRNRFARLLKRKRKVSPSDELVEIDDPSQPGVAESINTSSKSNGSAKICRKGGTSKKTAKSEFPLTQQELLTSDLAAETKDEVLLEIRKSLIKKT